MFLSGWVFIDSLFKAWFFCQFKHFFLTITETSQICKFTMSDFEFFFRVFFSNFQTVLVYIDLVNLFCVISRAKCIRLGLCISVWMGRKNFQIL